MIPVTPIIGIAAALVLSLAGNAWQLHHAGVASAEHKAALELAVKNGELAAARIAQETSAELAADSAQDHADLLDQLNAIAARGQATRIVYKKAAAAAPLDAICAPGQARQDAVNAALGGAK